MPTPTPVPIGTDEPLTLIPFVPLAARLQSLPRVLAGPMLRRVESTSVSVFVACRESFTAQLHIARAFDGNGQPFDITDPTKRLGPSFPVPPPTQSIKLGAHLHVALVTILPALPLAAGVVYQYSLEFTFGGTPFWLHSDDVFSTAANAGVSAITYVGMPGPTFVLPGDTPATLLFAHASCRKPHGGKVDALGSLDLFTAGGAPYPDLRPQQLFLTGDQVYTDEVDPTLLYMLRDASKALLGYTTPEFIPIIGSEDEDLAPDNKDRKSPGKRQETANEGNLTSEEAASHLFYLGEFYAMYLFVWSETLWPATNGYPSMAQVLPDIVGLEPDSKERVAYLDSFKAVAQFRADLGHVRSALANIATYMMMDDHEISDDLFLSQQWCKKALVADTFSRRVILNGLAAFSVFQAWGNTPEQFGPGSKGAYLLGLLQNLAQTATAGFSTENKWFFLDEALMPRLKPPGEDHLESSNMIPDWNFHIDFGTYRLIVLDTRTHRGFDSLRSPSRLIALHHIAQQLPNVTAPNFALVISPAPVAGHVVTDDLFEDVLQPIINACSSLDSTAYLDFEQWSYNSAGKERVLFELTQYERVIILSGDVHYSFSNVTDYWDDRDTQHPRQARFLQFCSSSAKNTGPKPEKAALLANNTTWNGDWVVCTYAADVSVNRVRRFYPSRPLSDVPTNPPWQYRVQFGIDGRDPDDRDFDAHSSTSANAQSDAEKHRDSVIEGNKMLVSADNWGLVSFEWDVNAYIVHHQICWTPRPGNPEDPAAGHTRHSFRLAKPTVGQKPFQ